MFQNFLSRRQHETGSIPTGVPVNNATPQATVKVPLPLDFTKQILNTRNPKDPLTDSDATNNNSTVQNVTDKPINDIPLNMYRLVTTNKGSFLVPLQIVTVGSDNAGTVTETPSREILQVKSKLTVSTGTVTTPAEVTSKVVLTTSPQANVKTDPTHCTCCILLRKITKKQTVITDFFRKDKSKRKCYCSEIKYPKVTNKLRLLSNNFKNHSGLVFKDLETRLEDIKHGRAEGTVNGTGELGEWTLEELGKKRCLNI